MNEDLNEDLKWLAENRNEWIKSAKSCDVDRSRGAVSWRDDKKGSINRAQWQAARDELGLNHSVEPTEKVWRGPEDGLPPVGIECEFHHPDFGWTGCTVVGHFRHEAICAPSGGNYCGGMAEEFRPIRSEEDKAVEELTEVIVSHYEYPKGSTGYLLLAK